MSVYKPCDIRGDSSQLSPALYRQWATCLALRLPAGTDFIIGGDVRLTTPVFQQSFIEGLLGGGVKVIDLGIVPTPMVYFARRFLDARACAMITASHSPAGYNGLKWMLGDFPPTEEQVLALRDFAQNPSTKVRPRGTQQKTDISTDYIQWLKRRFQPADNPAVMHVIIDPGNGCWAGRAINYLKAIFPSSTFEALHDAPDGRFPERNPDSARPEYLTRLAESVIRRRADLGVAFDGDGDRVSFIDSHGHCLSAEQTAWVLLHGIGSLENEKFVYDLKSSSHLAEAVQRLGGQALPERSGHAFIRTRMLREHALFGAEISGHFFYRELHGGDDGLFTACLMIQHLSRSSLSLGEWRAKIPPIFMTPDLRIPLAPDLQDKVLEQVEQIFSSFPRRRIDGVRIDFPDGWALVRKSVTAPELTLRFEGVSRKALNTIIGLFQIDLPILADGIEKCLNAYSEKSQERNLHDTGEI